MYLGDFADNAIVPLGAFTTNAADGGRESMSASLEEADITIYSDDGDGTWTAMTLDASTIIITENPGSQVGVYLVAVDMNNDADFATGKDYVAVLYPDETVDSQSVAAVLGHWSCENRKVNVGQWLGTAVTVSSTSAKPEVDVASIDDDATAAANAEAFFDGTGYAGTNNVIPTVTTLTGTVRLADGVTHGGTTAMLRLGSSSSTAAMHVTNSGAGGPAVRYEASGAGSGTNAVQMVGSGNSPVVEIMSPSAAPSSTDDGMRIAGVESDIIADIVGGVTFVSGNIGGNVNGSIGSLSTTAKANVKAQCDTAISDAALATAMNLATVDANVDTLLTRITSTLFAGVTSLINVLGALAGKTADATTLAEINATTAGAGYDNTIDSQEAIRDRGDAAWATGSVTVTDISSAALAKFATEDTGETTAVAGSVGKIAQGAAGGNVTVEAMTQAALDQLAGIGTFSPALLHNQLTNEIKLVRGDDYLDADGRSLTFTILSGEVWPTDLSGYTVEWSYRDADGTLIATVTGTVDTATGDDRQVHFDITAADLPDAGDFAWDMQFTDGSGNKWTPRLGVLMIVKDATP